MEARFNYNDTVPNHYWDGVFAYYKRRNGAFICREDIYPSSEIKMPGIDGLVICGTRGGQTFEKVQRPSVEGVCPEGTYPCSLNSPENTVCYPPDNGASICPITEIAIVN